MRVGSMEGMYLLSHGKEGFREGVHPVRCLDSNPAEGGERTTRLPYHTLLTLP